MAQASAARSGRALIWPGVMALERAKRPGEATLSEPLELEPEKKRRRIPLEQVVQELSHVGLTQPALSFVQEVGTIEKHRYEKWSSSRHFGSLQTTFKCYQVWLSKNVWLEIFKKEYEGMKRGSLQVDKRRRLALPEVVRKRDGQDLVSCDAMKRRRIVVDQISNSVPVLKVPTKNVQSELAMQKVLPCSPFRSQVAGTSLGPSTVQLLLSGATGLRQVTMDSHGIMFEVYDHGFMWSVVCRVFFCFWTTSPLIWIFYMILL